MKHNVKMLMPAVSSISIYPIKSFGPLMVPSARVVDGGGLEHDREFGLFDGDGKYVNGKRNAKVHSLTAAIDWKDGVVFFKPIVATGDPIGFDLRSQSVEIEAWLAKYFDQPIFWRRNSGGGFPDDTAAPGPTIVSNATYAEVARWYPGLSVGEIRKRFRANIELSCEEPFWEDRLFTEVGHVVRFKIGDVEVYGTNPCKRCVVPTRETLGGAGDPEFPKIFMQKREAALPEWSTRSRFDHFYRLCINTRIPISEVGKVIHVGDEVEVLGVV